MSAKVEVELKNFFIFNSAYESKEGEEHHNILYYYPPNDDVNTQVKNVGLVEALIKFTGNFKPKKPVRSLHTQKKRQLYYQPEENYWMVMTVNLPYISKSKNGSSHYEYLEEDVQDNVYEAVLTQAYKMYRLFYGGFGTHNTLSLKARLELFYRDYLKKLKLVNCDILDVFSGIHFLPLHTQNFLNVQCFINLLECNYPIIRYVAFLYNDGLIWSGVDPNDMQLVYQYLIRTLLPEHMETELQGGSIPRNSTPFANIHYGRFVIGPHNLKSGNIGKIPKVFLNNDDNRPGVYNFVVYRALSSTVCLFIDGDAELTLSLFKELDDLMGPKLSILASDIAEYCSKHNAPANSSLDSNSPRFIYFNKLNLAYKSTVHLDNRQTGNLACSTDTLRIIADMNSKKSSLGASGEIIVKTMNDYWIVGKISNMREFYVALQQKNATLIDISDEVKKICDTELKGIFFHPV